MTDDVSDARSKIRLEGKHGRHQVHELGSEEAIFMMFLVLFPEFVNFVSNEVSVVCVCGSGLLKRWVTGVHAEQDDGKGEDVYDITLISMPGKDLGCHVTRSSNT